MISSEDLELCSNFSKESFLYHCCLYIVCIMHSTAFIESLYTVGDDNSLCFILGGQHETRDLAFLPQTLSKITTTFPSLFLYASWIASEEFFSVAMLLRSGLFAHPWVRKALRC
jgi:hypothetical protein